MNLKDLLQYSDLIQGICFMFILGIIIIVLKVHYNGFLISFKYNEKKYYYKRKYRIDYLIIEVFDNKKEKLFNFKIINTAILDRELKNKIKLKIDKYNREGV